MIPKCLKLFFSQSHDIEIYVCITPKIKHSFKSFVWWERATLCFLCCFFSIPSFLSISLYITVYIYIIYSSARGGARNKIKTARAPIPKTGKANPPKSETLAATIWDDATWEENSAMVFSIRFNLGASRATKAGDADKKKDTMKVE